MALNPLLLLLLIIPAAAALLLAVLPRLSRRRSAWIGGGAMLLTLLTAASIAPEMLAGGVARYACDWLPQLGLSFSLRVDALAWLFVQMIAGVGALVVLYAHYYLASNEPVPRFYAYLMAFATAMIGVVISGNLLLLVVFWELTSLCSFLLIGFWRSESEARRGARMALTITAAGGLALLAAVLLIGQIVGSLELDAVLSAGDAVRAHPRYHAILALVLLAAFTKSAQFPFHFWLPNAMAAPTPVSAFLHSATMVKAGVFLLARLYPTLAGSDGWFYAVSSVGMVTMLIGARAALYQHDLKGLLAYSTISHLGLITLLLGLQSPLTVVAAVFHMLNHATFKASLFMAAGIIDHECGTRDMRHLKGLMRYLPWTGALAIVAAAAMAGVPLLNGFLSKEMFFAEALTLTEHGWFGMLVPVAAMIAAILGVAYSARFIDDVYFGTALSELAHTPHEPPLWMKVPVAVLVLLCVAVGSFPAWTIGTLLHAAATATAGQVLPAYSLVVWHGLNAPLAMSVVALAGGLALYFEIGREGRLHLSEPSGRGRSAYEHALAAIYRAASALSRALELPLSAQLAILLGVSVALASMPWLGNAWPRGALQFEPAPWPAWLLLVVLIAATAALIANHRSRPLAILLLGIIGLLVSLAFVLLSAPDLALTQLLVEVASVLLLLLALRHLPTTAPREAARSWRRIRDALLAGAAGGGVAALCYTLLTHPPRSVAQYYLENAVSAAGGSNAVNTIIVDFRALDTLGEISVFAIAALAIHALISPLARRPLPTSPTEAARPLLLRTGAALILPIALLVALYLLLRGHNQPGGGFVAGLVTAAALFLQSQAHDPAWVNERLRWPWNGLLATGLLLAALTGVGAWLAGYPLLTSYYQYLTLPVIGKVPLSSALVFDIGVFLVVSAGSLIALNAIANVPMNTKETPWKR